MPKCGSYNIYICKLLICSPKKPFIVRSKKIHHDDLNWDGGKFKRVFPSCIKCMRVTLVMPPLSPFSFLLLSSFLPLHDKLFFGQSLLLFAPTDRLESLSERVSLASFPRTEKKKTPALFFLSFFFLSFPRDSSSSWVDSDVLSNEGLPAAFNRLLRGHKGHRWTQLKAQNLKFNLVDSPLSALER